MFRILLPGDDWVWRYNVAADRWDLGFMIWSEGYQQDFFRLVWWVNAEVIANVDEPVLITLLRGVLERISIEFAWR